MNFKFSGHEGFPCRYTWIPKAVQRSDAGRLFSDEDQAMVQLGVGKNMVRAIRFWAEAAELFVPASGKLQLTEFARDVFAQEGFDPFLEEISTLWLIHWKLATNVREPLFAWYQMFNAWFQADFTRTEVLRFFQTEIERSGKRLSTVTLESHFTVFLHTYVSTAGRKAEVLEDNLDSPLVELELIERVGDRISDSTGRREGIYAFRMEEKPGISPELFAYCVDDYWRKYRTHEKTLSFRDISAAANSPGQVFKLPEHDIRARLEVIDQQSEGAFGYEESAAMPRLVRGQDVASTTLLARVFAQQLVGVEK